VTYATTGFQKGSEIIEPELGWNLETESLLKEDEQEEERR
jgi:hypothetical protein